MSSWAAICAVTAVKSMWSSGPFIPDCSLSRSMWHNNPLLFWWHVKDHKQDPTDSLFTLKGRGRTHPSKPLLPKCQSHLHVVPHLFIHKELANESFRQWRICFVIMTQEVIFHEWGTTPLQGFCHNVTRNTDKYPHHTVDLILQSLCLIKHHTMTMYGGMELELHTFLTSILDGGKQSGSCPGRLTPGKRALNTHWTGVCGGSKTGLDAVEKRGTSAPAGNRTPAPWSSSPLHSHYPDWTIPAPNSSFNLFHFPWGWNIQKLLNNTKAPGIKLIPLLQDFIISHH
jgi:hypothetical protein